ncbi:hypothetical protein FRC07_003357 [Ceratobasidium sp. 392]|nr:hypothetical protein FRC07_003357 [Ceratobasidium sp. 392]
MTLLPQVVWLGTTVQDRYGYIASEVRDLVTAAAAAAIQSRQYSLAVEWLEQGRSIVWNQTQHLRTPLDDLRVAHPGLADQLQEICTRLEAASIPHKMDLTLNQNQSTPYEAAQVHRRSAENYDQLLESIRSLDGFEGFLRPIPSSILIKNLGNRTVVIINVHKTRCDALVVRPCSEDITSVSLTRFSVQKAKDAHAQLGECIQGAGNRRGIKYYHEEAKVTFTDILKMLWYDVAQPVLAHLNIAQVLPPNDDNLPHITWCTSGALSFLPLHAAGDYNSPSTVLSSLVISSYTPTLGVLGQSTLAHDPFSGILAVGHESAVNGLTALPGTRTELERVQQEIKGLPFTRLEGEHACVNTVLEAMENHNWIHFACHGSQNANDPMQSAFHLHDGDLDLAKIAQRSLKNAQLAFLSACETATGYATLPDESVHLAAGLLMAGYPTVIATMWSIHDEDAPLVAGRFYEHLLKGGPLDSGKAAKALHTAVADLREQIGVDKYARWMPYVNIGR